MQESEMRFGMNLPGRLAAFIAMRTLTESDGERWRTSSPKVAICVKEFQPTAHHAKRENCTALLT